MDNGTWTEDDLAGGGGRITSKLDGTERTKYVRTYISPAKRNEKSIFFVFSDEPKQ